MNDRVNNLLKKLKTENIDSVFITSQENVFYFSSLYANVHERLIACYFDQEGRELLIVPALELGDVKKSGWQGDVISYFDHENPWD